MSSTVAIRERMRLHLVDSDADVASALREAFRSFPEVSVACADLLDVAHNTVVSPGNAAGFMDGGIDAHYRTFFGAAVESRVRDNIARRPAGHLPVGASLVVHTEHARIPYLIVAPTMPTPEPIDRTNCFRAMRAVLRVAASHEDIGRAVFCPGLGTGVGGVAAKDAALEMAHAYRDWREQAEAHQKAIGNSVNRPG
jgi:O-acetyl-ADP-ribose deacetylase (regulator of RNase III)